MTPKIVVKDIFDYGGKTLISLVSDNDTVIVANKKGMVKVLKADKPEQEPEVIEIAQGLTSVHGDTNGTLILTNIEGNAFRYTIQTGKEQLLTRSSLPLHDSAIVHSGRITVIGGDDLELSLINLENAGDSFQKETFKVDEQVSQLSCNSKTNILAVSFVNGKVQFFSLNTAIPNKVHELSDYIPAVTYDLTFKDPLLENILGNDKDEDTDGSDDEDEKISDSEFCDDNRICTRTAWSPSGLLFALPCKDKTIKMFSIKNYELVKTLTTPDNVSVYFIDLQFDCQYGNYIAAADLNNKIFVWKCDTGELIYSNAFKKQLTNISWRLQEDGTKLQLIAGTWSGSIITIKDLAKTSEEAQTEGAKNSNLFVNSDISESENETEENQKDGANIDDLDDKENLFTQEVDEEENTKRKVPYDDEEDFIEDDDGAGYVIPNKRHHFSSTHGGNATPVAYSSGRPKPFQYTTISPGSTPFGSLDRRYLTMNTVGYVVTVRNNEQNSITISFFDLSRFTETHFEDLFGYDICSLNENATLFAQSKSGQIHYRPHSAMHSNWTKVLPLQRDEKITSVAATNKRVYIGTSFGYLRTFNIFGVPLAVEKVTPIVSLVANEFRIFIVHYSPFNGVSYSLYEQGPQSSKYFQRESPLPIFVPQSGLGSSGRSNDLFTSFNPLGIKSMFFNIYGDPCIFGSDNLLMVLSKWRSTMEARWVPLLDANIEIWKMSGGKETSDVSVWPLGLTYDVLNCILVKGKNFWPGFPLPLPSELGVRVPILVKSKVLQETKNKKKLQSEAEVAMSDDETKETNEELEIPVNMAAEEEYIRSKVLSSLLSDTLENDGELYGNENEVLTSLVGTQDKSLLRLFADACSEQNSDKAMSIVFELKQDRALNAAVKISERAEMLGLVRRINAIREAKFEEQMNSIE
ncbi:hypothetical protein TPHA_0D04160 [Tetrapisispora phaffii CBS 4417]|uniref:Uncharacterized protein n=1 Tax=Tetrapisispora phaffii (strain ATCC 24235 / CBS 4417 / NBRC 1672 / NRRL Y-8282 / UCD 70-5) TaxID=1071381 RepID=G8BT78_TETPH|nr:hypothetical protein TPHA_0D04160 [Tetrapisispora phaffii CBS 4417]CCE63049.1 hypothetical protein TPHA_0D04160 [Tetrapisispora phaffii CBS 4417]